MKHRPRVLLVYALPRSGHSQAAAALREELEEQGARVEEYNFQEQWERLGKKAEHFQKWIVEHVPWFWKYMHGNTDYQGATDFLLKGLMRWDVTGLFHKIETFKPDAIVASHVFPLRMLGEARLSGFLQTPLFVLTTDLWAHAFWAHAGVDGYFVGTQEVKRNLVVYGIREERIQITGVPLRPVFSRANRLSQRLARKRLALSESVPHLTVVGGNGGIFPFQELLEAISHHQEAQKIQWTFLFGYDEKALKKAKRFVRELALTNIRLSRFTKDIDTYFLASDAVITKPGGLSTSEVMACGVPLILCTPIPGQEEGNARVLCEAGAAIREDDPKQLMQKLRRLLGKPASLKHMVRQANRLMPARAAERVTQRILQYVSRKNP